MSLILCLSPAYQPLLCGLVGRDVCVPHFSYFCVSHQCTSPLCGLVGGALFPCFYVVLFHQRIITYNFHFMQERSLYTTSLKMNGSELLFVYNNVEMVATFVVYLFT